MQTISPLISDINCQALSLRKEFVNSNPLGNTNWQDECAKRNGDIYKISAYASKNEIEFFAECFSMYANGEQLSDYIVKDIERILNIG